MKETATKARIEVCQRWYNNISDTAKNFWCDKYLKENKLPYLNKTVSKDMNKLFIWIIETQSTVV